MAEEEHPYPEHLEHQAHHSCQGGNQGNHHSRSQAGHQEAEEAEPVAAREQHRELRNHYHQEEHRSRHQERHHQERRHRIRSPLHGSAQQPKEVGPGREIRNRRDGYRGPVVAKERRRWAEVEDHAVATASYHGHRNRSRGQLRYDEAALHQERRQRVLA